MIVDLVKILNDQGNSIVSQIRANLAPINKTGKTSASIKYSVTVEDDKTILRVTGKPFVYVVETGRKATPDKKPSEEMIKNIREWVKAIGKPESMVWAVATKIQKEGTELYRAGGRKDIISNVVNEQLINQISKECLDLFAQSYLKIVADGFNISR